MPAPGHLATGQVEQASGSGMGGAQAVQGGLSLTQRRCVLLSANRNFFGQVTVPASILSG